MQITTFLLTSAAILLTPGPTNTILAASGAAMGLRQAKLLPLAEALGYALAIGFFLSGHPLDDYSPALKRLRVQSWTEFSRAVKTGATAGRVARKAR